MKQVLLFLVLNLLVYQSIAQAQYDGALERYKMKSDESVREGLIGEYYSGDNFNRLVKVKQDKEIYFDWNYSNPIPELGSNYFSIRWRGKIYSEKEGNYIITAYTDDGMRIWLNGRIIINSWKDQPPTLYEARVVLEADEFYDIRIDYYQKEYQTTAAVFFNPEGEERQSLNASNTLFGRDLEASTAKFDFWEKQGLVEEFWTWLGIEEKNDTPVFTDQSYKADEILIYEKVNPIREEQLSEENANSEITIERRPKFLENEEKPELNSNLSVVKETTENRYENMQPGETLIIENIYFDQGKAILRSDSNQELEKLLTALEHHKDWNIKIDGHTDNVGYAALNLELSYDRARSVYFYLVKNGIDKKRLKFEGFGSSKPLIKNNSEENKQLNRRVEISLI